MNSKNQNDARRAAETACNALLADRIGEIVAQAQEQEAAEILVKLIWPTMKTEDMILLETRNRDFLLRSNHVPPNLAETAEQVLLPDIQSKLQALAKTNRYARGVALANIVKSLLTRREDDLRRAAERLFEQQNSDRLASVDRVRSAVIGKLVALSYNELRSLAPGSDENEAKRHLKILTVLTNHAITSAQRSALLKTLINGRTMSFPYVLKYLSPGNTPEQRSFQSNATPSIVGFTPQVERLIPEATPVKKALQNYLGRSGILAHFLDVDAPVVPELSKQFENLPQEFQMPGGLFLPKKAHLHLDRNARYRLPDGIVCAIGLTIVLESLLRQAQNALSLPGGLKLRGRDLVPRVAQVIPLTTETVAHMNVVFGSDQIALRDAVAHGVFIANDESLINNILGGLTRTLELLINDIHASGHETTVFSIAHWAAGTTLDAVHNATFARQFACNLNLLRQTDTPALQKHAFKILKALTPDKSLLGKSSCLVWSDLSGASPGKLTANPEAEYVGIIGLLVTLEELFRAVQEVYGERVLSITPDHAGSIKCELSILDDQQGRLLDSTRLAKVFGTEWNEPELRSSVAAVRALRDKVLHGYWGGLSLPKPQYLHLIAKLVFTLSSTVSFTSSGWAPTP